MNRFLCLFLVVLACVGCGAGPIPWQVVSQTQPNPLLGQTHFAVAPIDFSTLMVGNKSEAEYLSVKKEETQESWTETKATLEGAFVENLTSAAASKGISVITGATGAPFIIRPKVNYIEPGFYAYVSAMASDVKMYIQIATPEGAVIDEFQIENGTEGSLGKASTNSRLKHDGTALGKFAARYLAARTTGGM
jgi:hypothetical protein